MALKKIVTQVEIYTGPGHLPHTCGTALSLDEAHADELISQGHALTPEDHAKKPTAEATAAAEAQAEADPKGVKAEASPAEAPSPAAPTEVAHEAAAH